jgi:hypothetical protein
VGLFYFVQKGDFMQYPKMVFLKAQDTAEGIREYKLVQNQEEEAQALSEGYVTDWRECSVEEVRKRGRPPKTQPETIPETAPQNTGLFN